MNVLKKPLTACLLLVAFALGSFAQVNITTWQVNLQHTGANLNETTLTPGVVAASGFGLLFTSPPLDGQIYGQPLFMSNVDLGGGTVRNIVYVATQRDNVYALDGDTGAIIWSKSLLPDGAVYPYFATPDITDALGLTATPVIDPVAQTIYVVAKFQYTASGAYQQQLHALDLKTGADKANSPVVINPSFAGSSNFNGTEQTTPGVIPFNSQLEHERAALILYNGVVYLSYASHNDHDPYHGEVIGYDATSLQLVKTFIVTPNKATKGGIWNGGAGPAVDEKGNLYVATGNGAWDQDTSPYTTGTDWSMSFLKLPSTGAFTVSYVNPLNWFTPTNWSTLNNGDLDLGSSGVLLLPDQSAGPHTRILVGGGKGGTLYVVDRDNMGGLSDAFQQITEPHSMFVTPAYFNGNIYFSTGGGPMEQRAVGYNPVTGNYISPTAITTNYNYNGGHGSHAFITANGNANGVVWTLNTGTPALLHAYNAANISGNPIFVGTATLSGQNYTGRKFTIPMVANGKAYFTADANDHDSRLFAFGPPPPAAGSPSAPTGLAALANSSSQITLSWTDNSNNETSFKIKRATSSAGPFTVIGSANANETTYVDDTGLSAATTYYYEVASNNAIGDSNYTLPTPIATFPLFQASGLVSYWPLDEAEGGVAHDITGSGRDGAQNGEAAPAAGFINFGMNIHGTGNAISNVAVPNSAALQFTASQSFTLSAWLRPSGSKAIEQAAISKSFDQGNFYGISINPAGQWVFRGKAGDVVGPAVSFGSWTHVAVVQDGSDSSRKIYVNGSLAGTGAGAAQAANGAGALWFGQANPGTGIATNSFGGDVDEVRLYNRALPASEISTLLSPPVLQAASVLTQGAAALKKVITPSGVVVVESRKGSPAGAYNFVLSFSAPVSGISASLTLQGGGAAVGSAGSVSYSGGNKVATIALTGVGNNQNLNLHLVGIAPGGGTADIPFKVLWGDINGDGVVNTADLNLVQTNRGATLTDANAGYDINADGTINATDEAFVASIMQGAGSGGSVPAITSAATKSGTVGSAFNYNITATNNPTSYDAANLPAGLSINNASGTISGIPTTAGSKTVTVSAINAYGPGTKDITLDIQPVATQVPTINSPNTATGTLMSSSFYYQITATQSPESFTATNLPGGLSLNPVTGEITGTPNNTGTTAVTLTAKNPIGTSANFTLNITVNGGGLTNLALAGTARSYDPDTGTVRTVIGTNTPALAIDNKGVNLTRWESEHTDPTAIEVDLLQKCTITYVIFSWQNAAAKNYTIQVSDDAVNWSASLGGETNYTGGTIKPYIMPANTTGRYVRMNGRTRTGGFGYSMWEFQVWGVTGVVTSSAPVINSPLTGTATVGTPYSYQITAANSPASFGATGLPAWASINSSGLITGTPTAAGPVNISISATNTAGSDTKTLALTVNPASTGAPSITSALSKSGNIGSPFSYQITATNSPATFGAAPLPHGLSVNTSGLISGTPTAAGTTNVTLTAGNGTGNGTATLVVTIGAPIPPPVINSSASKAGNLGTALTYQITATNNPASFTATGLPAGLSVDPATGAITGTPTAAGTTKATIKASNASGTGSAYLTFVIAAGPEANLSLGQPSYALSFQAGNLVASGNDASTATRWAAADGTFPTWWKVDLGGSKIITKVDIMWLNPTTRAYKYIVETSPDDSTYTTALDRSANTNLGDSPGTLPNAVTARWVRVTVTGSSNGGFASFFDCSVSGTTAPTPPAITSALTASGTTGTLFSYQMTASNSPTSFSATGLPAGLTLNPATGVISGIPTTAATSSVTLSATNNGGTGATSTLVLTVSPGSTSVLMSAVSRLTQGSAGALDLALPTGGTPATEVRSGSVAGTYSIVLTFSSPVSGITAALQLQAGQSGSAIGSAGSVSYSSGNSVVTIPLTGVANAQRLSLHLSGIQPGNGTLDIPFNLLTGDVNRDNAVNALDIGQVKTRSGQTVDQTTMSYDVNSDGLINTSDQTATKSWSGATLP